MRALNDCTVMVAAVAEDTDLPARLDTQEMADAQYW